MEILSIDAGTTVSGFAIISFPFSLVRFGKISNEELRSIVLNETYDVLVYEKFQSMGMPVGASTFESVEWNGVYRECARSRGIPIKTVYRKEEKEILCGSLRAKDGNIRQALIDRYARHDLKNGKGTKANPDVFYGVSKDVWAAIAVGVTYYELSKLNES